MDIFQSQPTKNVPSKKCHVPHHIFDSPPSYKGGLVNHDTNSNNPLFSVNSMINHPSKLPHNTTHLYRLLSFDLPPKNKENYQSSWVWFPWETLRKTLRRVSNYTYWNPTNESRKISVATRPKPAKAWQGLGLVGWGWLDGGFQNIPRWAESLWCLWLVNWIFKKICQVLMVFQVWSIWIDQRFFWYQLSAKCRM